MLRRAIVASRYIVIVPVACIALLATAICAYGVALGWRIAADLIAGGVGRSATKELVLGSLELVDLFLVGLTLYLIALGLYELFIDPTLPTPPWLVIRTIDDLKAKVLSLVVVILALLFLNQAITWDGARDLLRYGAATGAVIAALTYFLGRKAKPDGGDKGG